MNKIFICGHKGMAGSAIYRQYENDSDYEIITAESKDLDLRNQRLVDLFFDTHKPDQVILAAGKVGGIYANNSLRAEFIYDNLMIEANVINSAYKHNCKKLLFLGSSCIYPKYSEQPIKEEYLLTGELENTNEPYAIAKIAGIKLCESYYKQYESNFISIMPTNLYGPNDNFDLETSHVLPALMRKIYEAKTNGDDIVTIWGSGKPRREFLYVDDLALACKFVMENVEAKDIYEENISHLNVGTGKDCSITELAETIKEVVGYEGEFVYDSSKPDGTMRKLLDVKRIIELGWKYKTPLKEGVRKSLLFFQKSTDKN